VFTALLLKVPIKLFLRNIQTKAKVKANIKLVVNNNDKIEKADLWSFIKQLITAFSMALWTSCGYNDNAVKLNFAEKN